MKLKNILVASLLALGLQAFAQTNVPSAPITVKGDLNIDYVTRKMPKGTKGIQDKYIVNLGVANEVVFQGDMTDRPQVIETTLGFSPKVVQPRSLKYDISLDVLNPRPNAAIKVLNAGKMAGFVPIASDGTYDYDKGNLTVEAIARGAAGGKFAGTVSGKPLVRPEGYEDQIRKAVDIKRLIGGKPVVVSLTKYDKMKFNSTKLAAGPLQVYSAIKVDGEMYYDYNKECWYFNDFSIAYFDGKGRPQTDRIAGQIRWVKDKNRLKNGLSEYQFDLRINEPMADTMFGNATPMDAADMFAQDDTVPSFTGLMKYRDTIKEDGSKDGITLSSVIDIDLTGKNVNKEQVMALTKIIIFACVIPFNAD